MSLGLRDAGPASGTAALLAVDVSQRAVARPLMLLASSSYRNPMRKLFLCAFALLIGGVPGRVLAQTPTVPLVARAAGSTQAIDDVRKNYRLHAGPFYVNPALMLKELGVDTNVFNREGQQRSDFTFTVTPQATLRCMARRGLLKATLGTDLVYYAHYASERSVDPQAVVRLEGYARRVTLFVEESA